MKMNLIKRFKTQELVCPHVFGKYDIHTIATWIDPRLEYFLNVLGDNVDEPIIVNNYHFDTSTNRLTQRGLRCIHCDEVKKYIKSGILFNSPHTRFQAVDFNIVGKTVKETIHIIEGFYKGLDIGLRIELDNKNRVHVDVNNPNKGTIIYFKPSIK